MTKPDIDGRRRGSGGRERSMVPGADFTSYYGRPIVKAAPWSADIPAYLFLGGLAGGSSLLAGGSDLSSRPTLRRWSRITAIAALAGSLGALVHDLGRPSRFHHMLRVAKVTSPMSVGTWILTAYGPLAGIAAASEGLDLLPRSLRDAAFGRMVRGTGRFAGLGAATLGPAVASYTAALLSDTASPSWHSASRELPFVFVGSAAAAAGGMGMVTSPPAQAEPARRMAIGGVALDLAMSRAMESSMGLAAEPMREGKAATYLRIGRVLGVGGALTAALAGRRSRVAAVLAGAACVAGSACTKFGVFHAGQQSAADPRYTVVPQRARLERDEADGPAR